MQFPAVNWHEGLFLHPHHFQAWDRHWSERVAISEQWQNPFSYGIAEIAINSSALAAGFIQIDSLRAKTPGGVLVEFAAGQQPERRDVRMALELEGQSSAARSQGTGSSPDAMRASNFVDVYLAVPRLTLGGKNVDQAGHRNGARFQAEWMDLPDEIDAASVKPVEFRKLNAKILLSTDDRAGYDVLRIARIERGDRDGAIAQLDSQYIPPLLDCSAWAHLRSEILSPIGDWMLQASEQASQQMVDAGGCLQANSSLEVQRLLLLQVVNPAASVLKVLTYTRGIHPLQAYIELSRLAGALDIFQPDRRWRSAEAYDHENLGPLFIALKRRILQSLQSLEREPFRQRYFLGAESGMQLMLDAADLKQAKKWFIGVYKGDLGQDTLDELLSPGNLDWKLGSADQVDWLFTHRAPGLEFKQVRSVPAMLPKGSHWAYYEIQHTDSPAWQEIARTGSIAMRIKDSLIVNRQELQGNRKLVIQYATGSQSKRSVTLEFALFGVL